jgi:hypothetical protein
VVGWLGSARAGYGKRLADLSGAIMNVEPYQSLRVHHDAGCTMAKETKPLRKHADQAERMAKATADPEISENFLNLARAYRSQADVLKAKRKREKKRR